MNSIIKNLILGLAFLFTIVVSANNPGTDDLDKLNEVLPGIETLEKKIERTSTKDVQDVFMKIKRVDRILTPKKKLYKVKYTIA